MVYKTHTRTLQVQYTIKVNVCQAENVRVPATIKKMKYYNENADVTTTTLKENCNWKIFSVRIIMCNVAVSYFLDKHFLTHRDRSIPATTKPTHQSVLNRIETHKFALFNLR